ncbi:SMP-30/gluconolactonase/LRE family protein [Litorilituus sediminis]|uniref:SMP-30/gluconolactonase/LRE family protein n=1 Tax=Litorilituus sediminis TaxID=718192 RepID=A0A4P6P5Y2_9GAMM|nr:SMP-30/gluconolactonase/LRE family protein [Litorilituus sediminis]QBG35569.1 SMP-30/gluconolactonase/LRE family protein [Litorilituus sediminis]
MKKIMTFSILSLIAYLLFWPVEISPVAWQAPINKGYQGSFAQNEYLSAIETIDLAGSEGPEAIALSANGLVYFSLLNGDIKFLDAQGKVQHFANTAGRPLGIAFNQQGELIVADAFRGLLKVNQAGEVTELVTRVDGIAVNYANDLDIADDGKIYFSDASTKFHAKKYGTYQASLLDINEHAGNGRLLVFDPVTGKAKTLAKGFNFANGVALSHDQNWLLLNETGSYRLLRIGITADNYQQQSVLIDNLPSFPDNLSRGISDIDNSLYWLGLVSPRSAILDKVSNSPFLRKVIQRLPLAIRPKAKPYGHVIAINDHGEVIYNLQDPSKKYGYNTGALIKGDTLYVSSLHEKTLGKLANFSKIPRQQK